MRSIKRYIAVFTVITALLINIAGCGDVPVNEKLQEDNGKLVLNLEGGDWGYPSPYTHYSRGPGAYKMRLIFDSLIERGEDGYIPWLAESWELSEDGKIYTFQIREGVKWHDGEPMTAEDVKFSFEYFEDHPTVRDELGVSVDNFIEDIKVINDNRIKIEVKEPKATLLERFGYERIIPKHIWENVDDPVKFTSPQAVIGCGPYTLTDYDREQGGYRFKAFKDYWGPEQQVDIIQFIPVSDSILAFNKGDIDIANISPDVISKYQEDPQYTVIQNPAFWGYRLMFNMEKREEFQDKKVRQAIAYGIDKEELIEKVARGAAKSASPGYLPVDHVWYNQNIKKYDYDLEKSSQLLEDKEYTFKLLTGDSNREVRIGELIKLSLGNVGIDLKIQSADTKTRDAAVANGNYEIVLTGHGGWGNDADVLRERYGADNRNSTTTLFSGIPGYSNDLINKLSREQLYELDQKKRKKLVYQLQEIIAEEIPMIPLYNTCEYTVYRKDKYDGWKHVFNHHNVTHNKISYLKMD